MPNTGQARLSQTNHRLLADLVERIAEPDGRRRLAFACGCGAQGGDQNEFAVGLVLQGLDVVERDLRLVMAVILDAGGRNPQARGDLADGLEGCILSDPDVGTHDFSQCCCGSSPLGWLPGRVTADRCIEPQDYSI